jgi:hypothetical protein
MEDGTEVGIAFIVVNAGLQGEAFHTDKLA